MILGVHDLPGIITELSVEAWAPRFRGLARLMIKAESIRQAAFFQHKISWPSKDMWRHKHIECIVLFFCFLSLSLYLSIFLSIYLI